MNSEFYQIGPTLENSFESDPLLPRWIRQIIPKEQLSEATQMLTRCGSKAVDQWLKLSEEAESQPAQLVTFDPWGRRIDELKISRAWNLLEDEVATEGIIATAYEKKFAAASRPLQLAQLYLFHPSSAFVSCPLAMTDGAAKCLSLIGSKELQQRALPHLLSRNPETFWTSGQWMTEKSGGSDVSGTATIAKRNGPDFLLSGTKWFTSATHSQMSMLLAKIEDSKSLSLFFVETKDEQDKLRNIQILRLKDKLGTRAMPTAELLLQDLPGQLVGTEGQGVKHITTILNITRVYNSVCATAHLRRGIDLLKSYSERRFAFGKRIVEHQLHKELMSELETMWEKCFKFTFHIGRLLGKEECGQISETEKIELRCMTPLLKLYTAKLSMLGTSEICEGFGGVGYIEDSGIPKLLRDAQVFSIWEGTSNVLALDFLRALQKEPGALEWFQSKFLSSKDASEISLDMNFPEKNLRKNVIKIVEKYISEFALIS